MKQISYQITGMTCNHCKMHVQKALEGVAGVTQAEVELESGNATVTMKDNVTDEMIREAVREAGNYKVTE